MPVLPLAHNPRKPHRGHRTSYAVLPRTSVPRGGRRSILCMDEDDLPESPRCAECLTTLDVSGTEDHPYWWCPSGKVARLS
jgi:hypothetical protein